MPTDGTIDRKAGAATGPLEALGYFGRWPALFAPYADEGLVPARVVRADRGSVLVASGEDMLRAEASGRLRRDATGPEDFPATGDWVALDPAPGHELALVHAVLPRSSAFVRVESGKTSVTQVLAANMDNVFVVHAIAGGPNLRRIERELAMAWDSGAVPVVVLAKTDLEDDPDEAREAVEAIAPGVDVCLTSAKTGVGIEDLRGYVRGGRTAVLIGPSGAGKSTLVNALLGEARQATREVRVSDGKGRHTTVARELIPLPGGGALLDTPGLRALALTDADDGIAAAFPDIEALARGCRFRDCAHETEPGCAVLEAVRTGELASDRLESRRKLLAEARAAAIRGDARLRAEERSKWRSIYRSLKDFYRHKGH